MNIHQMQLRYQPGPDRLLWHVRTNTGALYSAWLTRRMVRLLWPPLTKLVTSGGLAQVLPHATVLPEAQAMLAQVVRERPLPNASFSEPFNAQVSAQPLGPEPLLPETVDLGPGANGRGLSLQLRETGGRALALQLDNDLATALLRLLEQAVAGAEWDLGFAGPAADDQAGRPVVLN